MAYTPSLKVKRATRLTKLRRLPVAGEILVKEGEKVFPETIVAETEIAGDIYVVDAAAALDLGPEEIAEQLEKLIIKKVGEQVEKGELIAIKKLFFGLMKSPCYSLCKGTISSISTITGTVSIQEPCVPVNITAYIPGNVVKILPREGAVIETTAAYIQGVFGVGGERVGEIKVVNNSPKDILTAEQIGPECSGKILVGGSLIRIDALRKAIKVGAKGIIVGGIDNNDLTELLGYEVGVAITGHEEIELTLIIMEGFSKMTMSYITFNLLKSLDGYQASINGSTQIRAGVLRPEIIIPVENLDIKEFTKEDSEISGGLQIGTLVRIIREPFFGDIGRVVELPVELQHLESGSLVRIVDVEIEGEKRVTVPRANVEIIEE